MSDEPTAPSMVRGRLIQAAIVAGMVLAISAGQPPPLVIGIGFVASIVVLLALRPTASRLSAAAGDDRVRLALQWAMLHVMLADGAPGADEAKRAAEVHRELLALDLPEDAVQLQAQRALSDGDDLRGMLEMLASELGEEEKAKVLEGAVRVAVADGDFDAAERPAVGAVAGALGLGADDVRAVVTELSGSRS